MKFCDDTRDSHMIQLIVIRAWDRARQSDPRVKLPTKFELAMDLSAAHANGCALDLDGLLTAADFDLIHDVFGVHRHIDRDTGKLLHCFLPRYTRPTPTADASDAPAASAVAPTHDLEG